MPAGHVQARHGIDFSVGELQNLQNRSGFVAVGQRAGLWLTPRTPTLVPVDARMVLVLICDYTGKEVVG